MKKYIIISIFSLFYLLGYGQINVGGKPYSWGKSETTLRSQAVNSVVTMDAFDVDVLLAQDKADAAEGKPYRYGYLHDVNLSPENSGEWEELPDGARLWRLKIYSPNAKSINLTYDKFWLPEGAKLFIYSEDKTSVLGAFTSLNNKGTKSDPEAFATSFIMGNTSILEYYEPKDVSGGIISIDKVISGYKNVKEEIDRLRSSVLRSSSSANDEWIAEKNAIAVTLWRGNLTTGVLINNTEENNTPYFVSVGNVDEYDKALLYWSVDGNIGNVSTVGLTELAFRLYDRSDIYVYRLVEKPSDVYGTYPYYVGWNTANTTIGGGVDIIANETHSSLIERTYSTVMSVDVFGESNSVENYWMIPSFYEENNINYSLHQGSPLFNNSHHLIGIFLEGIPKSPTGGGTGGVDFGPIYFKFKVLWDDYGSNEVNIARTILDPLYKLPNSGGSINGMYHVYDVLNISNRDITKSNTYKAKTINISNTTVSNQATLLFTAQNKVVITPETTFSAGTTVVIRAEGGTTRLASTRASAVVDNLSSIEESAVVLGKSISLSPNPTDGILNFSCSDADAICSAKVYSVAGALVYSNDRLQSGDIIDLTGKVKGVYMARIIVDGEVKTEKIILK